jgi:hypothetical protein
MFRSSKAFLEDYLFNILINFQNFPISEVRYYIPSLKKFLNLYSKKVLKSCNCY